MPKGTCRAEATSNSEKIKPVALAVIELRLSEGISYIFIFFPGLDGLPLPTTEGISQSVSYSVSQ